MATTTARRNQKGKKTYKLIMPYIGFYLKGKYYDCPKSGKNFVFTTENEKLFKYAKSIGGKPVKEVNNGREMDTATEERSATQAAGNSAKPENSDGAAK